MATGEARLDVQGHTKAVNAIALSADGSTAASAGDEGAWKLWSTADGAETVGVGGHDGTRGVSNWSHNTNSPTCRKNTFNTTCVMAIAISPCGKMIATNGSENGALILWDVATAVESPRSCLRGHSQMITSLSFAPSGARLASSDPSGRIIVWDVASGTILRILADASEGGAAGAAQSVAFAPDGRRVVSAGRELLVWDADTGLTALTLTCPWLC